MDADIWGRELALSIFRVKLCKIRTYWFNFSPCTLLASRWEQCDPPKRVLLLNIKLLLSHRICIVTCAEKKYECASSFILHACICFSGSCIWLCQLTMTAMWSLLSLASTTVWMVCPGNKLWSVALTSFWPKMAWCRFLPASITSEDCLI
jgi:hypothetical protein